jgi:hypothetical protein
VSLYGSTLDHHSHRPVTKVGPRLSTITLPAFDAVSVDWLGSGEIVRQYCYTVASNFALLSRSFKPQFASASEAFSLAIKYRRGSEVTRYKLWETDWDGESGISWPLYNGEGIYKNFVLEIWSLRPTDQLGAEASIPPWEIAANYELDALVNHEGYYWVGVSDSGNVGVEPSTDPGVLDIYWSKVQAAPALEDAITMVIGTRSLPTYPYDMSRQAQAAGTAVAYAELQQSLSALPLAFGSASSWLDNA